MGPIRDEDGTYMIKHNEELFDHKEDMITSLKKGDWPSMDT